MTKTLDEWITNALVVELETARPTGNHRFPDETEFKKTLESRDNQPLTLPHDPLVLSCASHRIFLESGVRWTALELCEPTPQDIDRAQDIRKTYCDRVLMLMLKNQPVSNFNRDLYEMLIQGACQKHQGMLYRLPYLYHEDQQREQLHEIIVSVPDGLASKLSGQMTLALTPITRILRSRRRLEMQELWFQEQNGYGVNWAVDVKNPLFDMVSALFDQGPFAITCMCRVSAWRGMNYLVPSSPRLA